MNMPVLQSLPFMSVLAGLGVAGVAAGLGWWVGKRRRAVEEDRGVAQRTQHLEDASRRYRLMVDTAHDLIAITEAGGKLEYTNAAFTRVLGFGKEDLRGQTFTQLVHPRQRAEVASLLAKAGQGAGVQELSIKLARKTGGWAEVEMVAQGLPDANWVIRNVAIHARDVSQRQSILEELARNELRFRDFAGSSADWLWETDTMGRFTYLSPGVANVLGYAGEELQGINQLDVLFKYEEDPARELVISRTERRQPYRELEFWTTAKNGERVCLRLSGVPVLDAQQDFIGYRGAASNITSSKMERDQVFRLATTDHLTGLLNSLRFKEELERAVTLARRHHTQGVVLFIDLDRFKEVNDTHGHEAGDQILQGIADILRENVRSTDVIARRGGDEFSIIMHNISVADASQKVNRMIEAVKAFGIDYHGTRLTVTMSVGMVPYPQEISTNAQDDAPATVQEKSADHLIMAADLAMYRAKDMGRNRLFVDAADATSETVGSVRAQLKWLERLRYCLEHEDFELHYQPIVPDRKNVPPLFEALLRIFDENGKVGSPALYIDAAEHFGLIQQLDLAVVKRVFTTVTALAKTEIEGGKQVQVSINLSCRTLGDPAVLPKLRELYRSTGVNPAQIIFEITETMALHDPAQMRDIDEIKAFIDELKGLGFRFALDDFGSGFTSFRYLKLLPVDMVKIDGEYVKNIVTNKSDKLFVEQMVNLSKGLGLLTVAEFVEDRETLTTLRELGVQSGQGWLFGRPQPDLGSQLQAYRNKAMGEWLETPPLLAASEAAQSTGVTASPAPTQPSSATQASKPGGEKTPRRKKPIAT
jgi:diguanylate cyclase (GGDEF)-like protein/PAS domain S-box-containing protein